MSESKIKDRMIYLLKDWLTCYRLYCPEYFTDAAAAQRINNGECGNTAQAISLVIESEFPGQKEVKLFANLNHAFLLHNDLGYDVQVMEGEKVSFFNEKYMDLDAKACTQKEVFDAYTYCDPLGCVMIRGFLSRHGVEVPAYFQKVIEEELGPNDFKWISPYLERELAVRNKEGLK